MARVRIQHKDMSLPQAPKQTDESPVRWMLDGTPVSRYFKDTYRSVLAGSEPIEKIDKIEKTGHREQSNPCKDLGLEQSKQVFLNGSGLLGDAPLWRDKDHWSILETGFGLGLNFLSTWAHWLSLPKHLKPNRLTFVSVEQYPVLSEDLLRSTHPFPELAPLVDQLRAQWFGLVPGFHKLHFERGAVTLLLGVDEVQSALKELQMRADTIFLDGFNPKANPQMWSHNVLGRIAQLARPGTQLATWCVSAPVLKSLQIHGFECQKKNGLPPKRHRLEAVYTKIKTVPNRTQLPSFASTLNAPRLGKCAVIGAGIAGASVAFSMAKRGWSVSVFDAAPSPAQGASGVPIGIFSTQVSADDNAGAQLSRAGVRYTEQLLLQTMPERVGECWGMSGVLEIRHSQTKNAGNGYVEKGHLEKDNLESPQKKKKRTADPSAFKLLQTSQGQDWCELRAPDTQHNLASSEIPNIWHKRGGWVDPTSLINALLNNPGITFCGNTKVTKIIQNKNSITTQNSWSLEFENLLNECKLQNSHPHQHWDQVVVTNALGACELLGPLINDETNPVDVRGKGLEGLLQSTYGQLTLGAVPTKVCNNLHHFPVNGEGSFVIRSEKQTGLTKWYAGSSFERVSSQTPHSTESVFSRALTLKRHAGNLEKLKTLYPAAFEALSTYLKLSKGVASVSALQAWSQWRCNTLNRLPWAQNFNDLNMPPEYSSLAGLSVLTGLGSKGLTLAPLCAELLACSIHLEPSPIEGHLQKNLSKINY